MKTNQLRRSAMRTRLFAMAARLTAPFLFVSSAGQAAMVVAPLTDISDGIHFNSFTDSTGLVGQYLLYRPARLSPNIPVPIVISLPGGGSANSQRDRTQFIPKAIEKGFVAVFISGVSSNPHEPWSARNDPTQPNVMRFINELIDHLKSDQNGGDVFLSGFSGGAMMTHTMACLCPQKIKAFASCAGAIYTHFGTKPTVPVSLIEIHAMNDLNVNVNGLINGKRGGSTHTSLDATFAYYKQVDGIDDSSLVTTPVTTPYLDGCVTKQTWSNAANGTKLELIVLNDMLQRPQSHHWPLRTDPAPFTGFDATSEIWDFFSQFITRPVVSIVATSPTAAEPSTSGMFTVNLDTLQAADVTVKYTISGSASNGSDYVALSGSVVIPGGRPSATILVSPIDDRLVEGAENVILTIAPDPAVYRANPSAKTATVAISDSGRGKSRWTRLSDMDRPIN